MRAGNPKGIKDWGDLVKDGVQVITPEPEDLAAGRAGTTSPPGPGPTRSSAATRTQIRDYMHELFAHVPVLDTGARGSTTTFAQRGIGDVLLAWENEAFLAQKELGEDQFEIV